jgi:hypothetical protein
VKDPEDTTTPLKATKKSSVINRELLDIEGANFGDDDLLDELNALMGEDESQDIVIENIINLNMMLKQTVTTLLQNQNEKMNLQEKKIISLNSKKIEKLRRQLDKQYFF